MYPRVLPLLCLLAFSSWGGPAFAARYVPIRVFLDGELILEGNASDDGDRDADAVWDALKEVNLRETEAFTKMYGTVVGDDIKIWKKREGQQPMKIKVEVAYGGVAGVTALHVERHPPDGAGRVWRIQAQNVDSMFNTRLIHRSDVSGLVNPKRDK